MMPALRLPKWRDHLIIYPVSSREFALNNLAIAVLGPYSIGPDPFDFFRYLVLVWFTVYDSAFHDLACADFAGQLH